MKETSFSLVIILLGVLFFYSFTTANMSPYHIALTFDDGPRPEVLKELMPLLEKYHIPATFFIIGSLAEGHRQLLTQLHTAGHEIENHTYGHENLKKTFDARGMGAILDSIRKTGDLIYRATGRHPRFFRPPFWEITGAIESVIADVGYTVVKLEKPDINMLDYEDVKHKRPQEVLVERVKRLVAYHRDRGKKDFVLVFHEHFLTTNALKHLIPYFQEEGYEFMRLDSLF